MRRRLYTVYVLCGVIFFDAVDSRRKHLFNIQVSPSPDVFAPLLLCQCIFITLSHGTSVMICVQSLHRAPAAHVSTLAIHLTFAGAMNHAIDVTSFIAPARLRLIEIHCPAVRVWVAQQSSETGTAPRVMLIDRIRGPKWSTDPSTQVANGHYHLKRSRSKFRLVH